MRSRPVVAAVAVVVPSAPSMPVIGLAALLPFLLPVLSLASCAPFASVGESCEEAPCAAGLVCVDGVCAEPTIKPPPVPDCVVDDDCAVDGDASGRVCDGGSCRFADCAFDFQCGTRICVDNTCAPAVTCGVDDDCADDEICDEGVCRPACVDDAACGPALGAISLQTCVEGRCLGRCLNDATCFGGGLCENNICVDPQCTLDADCGDERQFCDGGRCAGFTACTVDDECFDPNLFCDTAATPVRCAERPTCRSDNECGLQALCIDAHCRPADACFIDDDCDDDDECVASRCVRRPACRSNAGCADGEVCAELRCVAAPEPAAASAVVVADDVSACDAGHPCTRVLFVGERARFVVQGHDDAGQPVTGLVRGDATGVVSTAVEGDVVTVSGDAAGIGSVTFGDVVVNFVVVDSAAPLALLVVRGPGADEGAPASDVDVDVGGIVVATGSDGLASFEPAPAGAAAVVALAGARGVVVVDNIDARVAGGGRLRVTLPAEDTPATATAVLASVTSTGDELGPVGIGLVLASPDAPENADLLRVMGGIAQGEVQLQLLGAVPLALPSAMTLSAALPLSGEQTVRPFAEISPAAGPAFVLAFEGRREQQQLVQYAFAGDPTGIALDLAEESEGLDATLVAAGVLGASALVADDADRDNDGDTTELVADFATATTLDTTPALPPRERVALKCAPPPGSADRAFATLGLDLPGHFVVTGTGVVRGATGFEDVPLAEPMKAVPPPANLAHARRAVAVHAVFADDALSSRAVVRRDALPAELDIGALLAPPEGAFVLADVPAPGDRSVVLPAAAGVTHVKVVVDGVLAGTPVRLEVWSPATGAVRLPAGLDDVLVQSVSVYALDVDPFAATAAGVDVEHVATKAARAPGG